MSVTKQIAEDHPLKKAWDAYRQTDDFANSRKWANQPEHVDGSLWAMFMTGWMMATERAASQYENVNSASDDERTKGIPGAGAMGAVIEFRDLIRA